MDEEKLDLEPLELEEITESTEELELEPLELEEIEEPSIIEQVPTSVYGGAAGLATQKALEKGIDMSESAAEQLAFRSLGGGSTRQGKNLINQLIETGTLEDVQMKQGRITPRSIGRRALDEGLLSGDLEKVQDNLFSGAKESRELLQKVEGKKDLEELMKEYKTLAGANELDPTVQLDKQQINMLEKQTEDFVGERTATQLEKAKRALQEKVDYGTEGATARAKLNKAQARAYRESVEDLVKSQGGEELLDQFKSLKKASGERGIIQDLLKEDLGRKAIENYGGTSFETAKAGMAGGLPGIAAKKIIEGGSGMGAKALDVASKIGKSKPVRGLLKSLPFIGAGLTYSEAKASGASDVEAAALTAVDEATDVAFGVPKLAAQTVIGNIGSDEASRIIEDPNSSPEQKIEAQMKLQKDIISDKEMSKPNRDLAVTRYEQLKKQYDSLKNKDDNAVIETSEAPSNTQINTLINRINNSNVDGYKTFLPALERASNGTEQERLQAEFELRQQPAFRQMLNDLK